MGFALIPWIRPKIKEASVDQAIILSHLQITNIPLKSRLNCHVTCLRVFTGSVGIAMLPMNHSNKRCKDSSSAILAYCDIFGVHAKRICHAGCGRMIVTVVSLFDYNEVLRMQDYDQLLTSNTGLNT